MKVTAAAFLHGAGRRRDPDRVQRRRRHRDARRTSSPTRGTSSRARPVTRSWSSYWALLKGSVGSWHAISTTLERSAPLICAGLGVTLAFRAGLFNIGAQGQLIIGALVRRLRRLHLGPARRASTCWSRWSPAWSAARLWGGIAGFLKARTGAHEVITTIMLNYLAASVLLYALSKEAFQRPGSDNPQSPPVDDSATFPSDRRARTSASCVAILAALARLVGPRAQHASASSCARSAPTPTRSRTAGMSVAKVYTMAMVIAGALAGLAASMNVLGHQDSLSPTHGRHDRLRRDHRRPARPRDAARHRAGGPAVRRPERRRRRDAGQRRHAEGADPGAAGADRAVRRGAGAGRGRSCG